MRFRTEPFQILPLAIGKTRDTLEHLLAQLTNIEIVSNSMKEIDLWTLMDDLRSILSRVHIVLLNDRMIFRQIILDIY